MLGSLYLLGYYYGLKVCVLSPPPTAPNSYVEAPTPIVTVFGGGAFRGSLVGGETMRVELP